MDNHTKNCDCLIVVCDKCFEINDAIRHDHFKCLKKYVHQNPKLLNNFDYENSPLALAINNNNFKFVKFLLESGAYVDLICSETSSIIDNKYIDFENWIDFNALELAIYIKNITPFFESQEPLVKIIKILEEYTSIETKEASIEKRYLLN